MSRHTERPLGGSGQEPGPVGTGAVVPAPARRPNLSGDLEAMFAPAPGPAFHRRPLGYDRLQVDNYVIWAETALLTARQEADDLLDRYGRCWAELDLTRQAVVHSPAGQQMAYVTERIGSMLQLAADEAAEVTGTAAAAAERIQREARADADSQLLRAHEVKEQVTADAARLRRDSEADRAAAAAARQQAERDVEELLKQAAEERDRLDEEAALARARRDGEAAQVREELDREATERRDRETVEAAERLRQQYEAARTRREAAEAAEAAARERLAQVEEEAADLEHQRDLARTSLTRLCDQVSEAVAAVAESLPAPGLRLAAPQQATSLSVPVERGDGFKRRMRRHEPHADRA
jgi:cell division septum initiation protein DivIVA